jgi:hypothetical protein
VGEQGIQEGTKYTPLRGIRVVAYYYYLGIACQEVQDPVAEGGI